MNQPLDYKKLACQIGAVIADIIMIIGAIFTLVALIEIGRCETNLKNYLDSYDYNLLTMRTYGIAMMIGGLVAHSIYFVLANPKITTTQTAKASPNAPTQFINCENCGAKTDSPIIFTTEDNKKIQICPHCYAKKQ